MEDHGTKDTHICHVVDDSGGGDIRLVINRRYVSDDEVSAIASRDVSIISVNGAHEPLMGGERLGDAFVVAGAANVPASTIGADGNPLAVTWGYTPVTTSLRGTARDASRPGPIAPVPAVTLLLDFTTETTSRVDIDIAGYVSVPQSRVAFGARRSANNTNVRLGGGLLAGLIDTEVGGHEPGTFVVTFDNPDAQKQIRLRSTYARGSVDVTSEAIVQINRSGSIGINSWIVGHSKPIVETVADGSGTTTATLPPATDLTRSHEVVKQ